MKSKLQLEQKHKKLNVTRQNCLFNQTLAFEELIMFMDHKIRKQFSSFTFLSLCGSERNKFMVTPELESSFQQLNLQEKLNLYEKTIKYALEMENQNNAQLSPDKPIEEATSEPIEPKQPLQFKIEVEKGFKGWHSVLLTLDGFRLSSDLFQINLRNYLLRKSKKTDRDCYALQSIHQTDPTIIRFSFVNYSDRQRYLPILQSLIDRGYKEMIRHMSRPEYLSNSHMKLSALKPNKNGSESNYDSKREHEETGKWKLPKSTMLQPTSKDTKPLMAKTHSNVLQEMLKTSENQYLDDELGNIIDKENEMAIEEQGDLRETLKNGGTTVRYCKNIFAVMLPHLNLQDLQGLDNFKSVHCNSTNTSFIYQNAENHLQYKMELFTQLEPALALRALLNVPIYKNWHLQVVQGQMKMRITSQNSAIVYQKHKAYSKWYRERDYLYLRHVFKVGKDYFVADKSIENSNFIPFQTIVRGKVVYQVIKVTPIQTGSRIFISCQIEHGGLLNRPQVEHLTQMYLIGFQKLQSYYSNKQFCNRLLDYFRTDWIINQQEIGHSSHILPLKDSADVASVDFQQEISCNLDEDDLFFSIRDGGQDESDKMSVHELKEDELIVKDKQLYLRNVPQAIQLNEEGLVILPKDYLRVPHPNKVMQSWPRNRITPTHEDFLRRNHWVMNDNGGFRLINEQIIAAQNNVLSFIMSTLKKNIFSGKGALNISLPVTIFNCDSNLQRLCLCLSFGPDYLEKAAVLTDPIERMKYCLVFGLTNSILYFDIQKPFNPILGETYQGFIAGCPIYAEQVSHHPPVTAIYLLGRGYKVYGSIEATVNLHINSGDGINIGWYHILFDDGQEVCFQTPPAEFSGLTIGDRKFNFKGKGYYYDRNNQLYGEMKFQDDSGLFSNNKWKFTDQIEVQLLKVTQQFLDNFIKKFPDQKPSPSAKRDILERYFKMEGRWPFGLSCEGQQLYSVNQNLAFQLVDYQYPLNSNSNYREDLYYRKKNDLSRSQSQKERLEVVQREDRKWRAKYNKAQH